MVNITSMQYTRMIYTLQVIHGHDKININSVEQCVNNQITALQVSYYGYCNIGEMKKDNLFSPEHKRMFAYICAC